MKLFAKFFGLLVLFLGWQFAVYADDDFIPKEVYEESVAGEERQQIQIPGATAFEQELLVKFTSFGDSLETRAMILEPGKVADLQVHLGSDGDLVWGFRVSLVDETRQRLVGTKRSDQNGMLTFTKIPPGTYSLALRMSKRLRQRTTVRFGDVILTKHGKPGKIRLQMDHD